MLGSMTYERVFIRGATNFFFVDRNLLFRISRRSLAKNFVTGGCRVHPYQCHWHRGCQPTTCRNKRSSQTTVVAASANFAIVLYKRNVNRRSWFRQLISIRSKFLITKFQCLALILRLLEVVQIRNWSDSYYCSIFHYFRIYFCISIISPHNSWLSLLLIMFQLTYRLLFDTISAIFDEKMLVGFYLFFNRSIVI